MKRLATKLYKLQLKGELNSSVQFLGSVKDFEWYIQTELIAHANRMHMFKLLNSKFSKHNRRSARKRLHNWLDRLESGYIDYL